MKKVSNIAQWFFAVVFLVYGISMFTESVIAAFASLLFAISMCPLLWKALSKNKNIKKPIRIFLPVILFFVAVFATPTSSPAPNLSYAQTVAPTQANISTKETKTPVGQSSNNSSGDIDDLSDLTVHFIDVGQGDSTLITCGDEAMLIDAADDSKGTSIQNYLQKQGIKKLHYLVLTHPDADHIGGAPVIITKFDIGEVFISNFEKDNKTYQKLIQSLDNKSLKYSTPAVGTTYQLGSATFTIIAPNRTYSTPNDASIGLILQNGNNRFIFTGDAEETAEEDITSNGISLKADVYQVGHHGSNTSSSLSLLEAVNPSYAVISCGEGNSYGHPRAETLNNFRTKGIKVFRTDEQGTIVATSDGKNITWNSSPSDTWKAGEPTGSKANSTKATITTEAQIVETTSAPKESDKQSVGYVLNTKTKKFHKPSCGSLPTSNRQDSDLSRDEIVNKGYSPCKRCNP